MKMYRNSFIYEHNFIFTNLFNIIIDMTRKLKNHYNKFKQYIMIKENMNDAINPQFELKKGLK